MFKSIQPGKLAGLLVLLLMLLAACTPAAAVTSAPTQAPRPAALILATTTSTQDSGLLDYLLPDFEQEFNVKVKVIAVGSGQALQMGKDGNADVLLVHSPAAEKEFMDQKHGVRREDVMYNDFVIVGPARDPAGIKGMKDGAAALKKIADGSEIRVDTPANTRIGLPIFSPDGCRLAFMVYRANGVELWMARANKPLRELLEVTGVTKRLGQDNIYVSVRAAVTAYHARFGAA